LVLAINLAATLIIARLLTPAEYGVSVLGSSVYAITDALRELGGGAYLIQQRQLAPEKIRTTITVSLLTTLLVTALLVVLAGPLARFFDTANLKPYLETAALGYLLGPFMYPIFALMSRELAFGTLAFITTTMALLSAATTILLALLGFGYMSFAWGAVASTATGTALCFLLRRDFSIYRPSLAAWRDVIAFGAFDSATAVLSKIGESLPYLIFGKLLDARAAGLCQRAVLLCLVPERIILAGVGAVALPALSRQSREGRDLKPAYLGAIEYITAVQWPALILLALLAHPVVLILLGRQWLEVIPLMRILCAAFLFSFPIGLQYATLVAAGAVRTMPPLVAVQALSMTAVLWFTAAYGLQSIALSMLFIVPLNAFLSLLFVRRRVHFLWREFIASMRKSALASLLSAAGPLAIAIAAGWRSDLSLTSACVATILCALGWIGGLYVVGHPLLRELLRVRTALLDIPMAARAIGVAGRLLGGRG
jgi:O-antigen/teichoic acid export membrane protein